jgi:hypothetical protein
MHWHLCIIFLVVLTAAIIWHRVYGNPFQNVEGFSSGGARCPNLLVQKGCKFYLTNTKLARVPGVNPVEFQNLEEYTEFLAWQRGAGIRCPVLYLQESYDAQGNRVYNERPNPAEPQGGLQPVTAINSVPLPSDQLSDDAMDTNWGGPEYTAALVKAGYYKGNEVYMSGA